jgi:N-acetylglucosaminyldiphosphoundecaprenol N-acetyl-beta-D-mannosaminyltransferase
VDAQKDEVFKKILNSGDLNLCDGFGLRLVSGFKLKRYSGVDFVTDLCALAEKENKSIYLLGSGSDEVIKKTAKVLQEKFPMLKIVGCSKGLLINKNGEYNKEDNEDLIYDIIVKSPDILFVAFGHGKQEKWIDKNLTDLPSVKIAMGVGGSFDFISGYVKRAPKFLRIIGLEWLWRLILEPRRIGRIFKATAVFIYIFLRKK